MTDVLWLRELADRTDEYLRGREKCDELTITWLAPDLARLLADIAEGARYARDCISSPDVEYAPGKDIYDQHMMLGALRRLDAALARVAALNPEQQTEEGTA